MIANPPFLRRPALRTAVLNSFDPFQLPGNEAYYDLSGGAADSTYLIDGSNRLMLVADRSGNSAENGLVLNASLGASTPDSAELSITGDIDIRVYAMFNATESCIFVHKSVTASTRSYLLGLATVGANMALSWSVDGSAAITQTSTVGHGISPFTFKWWRATLDVDNGAGGYTLKFYLSDDGETWSQLGSTITGASTTSIFDSSSALQIGSGSAGILPGINGTVRQVQIFNGIGGTVAFNADFTAQAKLASSFTESSSNAATVTINTSGDTGARICGARDHIELTQAKQGITSVSAGYNIVTEDGSNDYSKTAPFSFSQPCTRYTVFKPSAWNSGNVLWAGNAANAGKVSDVTSTPQLQLNAGSAGPTLTTFVLGQWAVMVEKLNGASSEMQRNLGAPNVADAGSANPSGDTIGGDNAGANNASMAWAERLLRNGIDSPLLTARIVNFYLRKYNGLLTNP